MITKINEIEFSTVWRYKENKKKKAKITECIIRQGTGPKAVEKARGVTQCSRKDQFCKNCGRKEAMSRALREFTDALGLTHADGRTFRRMFWDSYGAMRHGRFL